ncbi:MAG: GAF domain-containing protein [Ardenticatenales bacterium]|nr:GAF domain-containing protein [Ardenticatenales bacterium]
MTGTPPPEVTNPVRLAALHALDLLDSAPEESFDRLTRLLTRLLHAPVALISLVDVDRQFFKSSLGLNEPWASRRETPLDYSFCQYVVASGAPLIVEDATRHPLVSQNLAISELGVHAYLGTPLMTQEGQTLGTLCVIDSQPREWEPHEVEILQEFTGMVMTEIDLRAEIRKREAIEVALARQSAQAQLLQQIAASANEASNARAALVAALRYIGAYMGWPVGHIYVLNDQANSLISSRLWHLDAPERFEAFRSVSENLRFRRGSALPGQVWALGQPLWISDVTRNTTFVRASMARKLGLRAALAFPILSGKKVVAVMEFFAMMPLEPDEALLEVMAQVGTQLGRVIEREQARRALGESEQCFRQVAETIRDAFWITDGTESQMLYISAAYERLWGRSCQSLYERPESWMEHVHPADRPWVRVAQGHNREGPQIKEHRILHQNGEVRWVRVRSFPLVNAQGEIYRIIGVSEDITERKKIEETLAQQAEELAHSNGELEQFASIASHDLQEPLRMITSYMELLERRYGDTLDPKGLEFIGRAIAGARRMQQLIHDLLAYARVGSSPEPLERTELNPLLDHALANLQVAIRESGASITYDSLPALKVYPMQILSLLQNLIGNALKFRAQRLLRIHIHARYADGHWLFAVQDNGIGFEAQHAERIFAIFQRLHNLQDYPGTGMGLAICKRVVERHQGRLWADSVLGEGTTFHFTLWENEVDHKTTT